MQESGVVTSITSNERAIAALKADGSVVTWGDSSHGGDCSKVHEQLTTDVQSIYSTNRAFAALKADGSVVAWGNKVPPAVEKCLAKQKADGTVLSTTCNDYAITALKADGSVVTRERQNLGS